MGVGTKRCIRARVYLVSLRGSAEVEEEEDAVVLCRCAPHRPHQFSGCSHFLPQIDI